MHRPKSCTSIDLCLVCLWLNSSSSFSFLIKFSLTLSISIQFIAFTHSFEDTHSHTLSLSLSDFINATIKVKIIHFHVYLTAYVYILRLLLPVLLCAAICIVWPTLILSIVRNENDGRTWMGVEKLTNYEKIMKKVLCSSVLYYMWYVYMVVIRALCVRMYMYI